MVILQNLDDRCSRQPWWCAVIGTVLRFVGHGLGPLLWVPMFAWSPSWTFVIASGLGLVTLTSFASSAQLMLQQQDVE